MTSVLQSTSLLVARVILGVVFMAHGWQKLHTNGMAATKAGFQSMDVPFATVSAYVTMLAEIGCGAALILGVLTPVAAVLLALIMVGAIIWVHLENGLFMSDGGFEYNIVLIGALLMIAAFGSGKFGLDALLRVRSGAKQAA
jgi:putative oxidoreductase